MLNKKFRLKKHIAFIATYKQGNVASDEFFILYGGRVKENNAETKFGFVVSKKIHKRAVRRNRVKRLMREVCRLGLKNKELESADLVQSIVIAAKPKALELDFKGVERSIYGLIRRLERKVRR